MGTKGQKSANNTRSTELPRKYAVPVVRLPRALKVKKFLGSFGKFKAEGYPPPFPNVARFLCNSRSIWGLARDCLRGDFPANREKHRESPCSKTKITARSSLQGAHSARRIDVATLQRTGKFLDAVGQLTGRCGRNSSLEYDGPVSQGQIRRAAPDGRIHPPSQLNSGHGRSVRGQLNPPFRRN